MVDERTDDSEQVARTKTPGPNSTPIGSARSAPSPDDSDDTIPDQILEMGDELPVLREFESFPHHPIHLLRPFLRFTPTAGLFDLGRTLWWRRKNPFSRMLWRELWGTQPLLLLALTILVASVIPFFFLLVLTPLSHWLLSALPLAFTRGRGFLAWLPQFLFPIFPADSSIWVAAAFAWRIRSFSKRRDVESELAVLPYWRPFLIRALAIQLCAAAILLAFLGRVGVHLHQSVESTLWGTVFPTNWAASYGLYVFNLPQEWQGNPAFLMDASGRLFQSFAWNFLYLGLFLFAILRSRTLPRLYVTLWVLWDGLLLYGCLFSYGLNPLLGWLDGEASLRTPDNPFHGLLFLVVNLLVIGLLWRLVYYRFCKSGAPSVPEMDTPGEKGTDT